MSIFTTVQQKRPKSTLFDLSHEHKLTTEMGRLTPFLCLDVLPGDRVKLTTEMFLRYEPLLAPIMHRVNVYTHFFFVPLRLIEKDWEDFITGGEYGNYNGQLSKISFDWSEFKIETSNEVAFEYYKDILGPSSLSDYVGIKTSQAGISSDSWPWLNKTEVNVHPYLAYSLIWNEYYRDQNLQEPLPVEQYLEKYGGLKPTIFQIVNDSSQIEGTNQRYIDLFRLKNRAWEKDYFTSALPWPQRGDQMTLPLSGLAPIEYTGKGWTTLENMSSSTMLSPNLNGQPIGNYLGFARNTGSQQENNLTLAFGDPITNDPETYLVGINNSSQLQANLSGATAVTVNELRRVMAIQRWMEANARGGSRYIEQLLMHFGIAPNDARLQRPEFLGGGKSPVVISEVLQQSATNEVSPQGNLAGKALSTQFNHSFTYNVNEHGFIIGIMSVMPRTGYMQGIPRRFFRSDKFEFAWPELANLGEQEILRKELYNGNDNLGEELFGYTPRYAEYKFMEDSISGQFRTTYAFWHLARNLTNPSLNSEFVTSDPSTRIFAVENANGEPIDHLLCDIYMNIKAIRPLPKYGTPI